MNTKTLVAAIAVLIVAIAAGAYFLFTDDPALEGDYQSLSPEDRQKVLDTLNSVEGSKLEKEERAKAIQSLSTSSAPSEMPGRADILRSLENN